MSITQQHLLDTYRARQLGTPAPPAPGTHVPVGRPARELLRRALRRGLRRQARPVR
ncbi:hypothetical protein [Streptomyces sp. NPDC006335]|uniref:hypothetical protein n=1 Tax=Streptomyces sp. NPDC006335 TaxID=3156895 RepID=UPI00339FBBE7